MNKQKKWFFVKLILIVMVISIISIFIIRFIESNFDINKISDYIGNFGYFGPLILLIMIIIASSIGFIFTIPVAVAALLLNFYWAVAISCIGLVIGAIISFYIARHFGRDFIQKKFIEKTDKLREYNNKLEKHGFLTVLFLRLISSLIPYEVINIASGFSKVKFRDYLFATVIGIIPGVIITVYFIKSVENLWSMHFFIATILMTGFSLLPLLSKKVRKTVLGFW
ncbi:MAG: VTT domain-containing protein [Candidatus Pacearchaeota archaeon]|jgi:uncharacterized membrane protein YdjX (TVP38/TMEM64 family)